MFRQSYWNEPLLSEMSCKGRRGHMFSRDRRISKAIRDPTRFVPEHLRRTSIDLPSLSEPQVIRHFVHLSQMNYGVDVNIHPLGSCTMKYNPKLAQRIGASPWLTRLHPYQPWESVQGILEILYRLSQMLQEITGTDRVSLAPAAGAHGEFVGALMIRAYDRERGEADTRNEMLVPDSAHGTNPASAAMAGFRVVKTPSDQAGLVDVEAVKALASKRTAGMMLTVPNTLGLFERNISEISGIVHDAGGLMYYDGANMNALIGRIRPGDMGFDIVHMNVHKTFATPHGGGGPGAGPLGAKGELAEYLPLPLIDFDGKRYSLDFDVSKSVGRVKGFVGNVGVLVKAYVYLLLMGRLGLSKVSEQAVLASNYLLRKIDLNRYSLPFEPQSPRKHEFVLSADRLKEQTGVGALEVGKALLDEGVHAPTMYFPLTVDEALMVEPTETEPVEKLDLYASALNTIAQRAHKDPAHVRASPRNTAVGRLDEVKASHPLTLTLNWRKIK